MDFSDKLNYLFELTHAEGKELAQAMSVTPPQVSKMRNGVRGLPKDKSSAQLLAFFFAQRISSDFQREALAKKTKLAQIRSVDDEHTLAEIILDWLSAQEEPDEYAAKRADDFLRQFGSLFDSGGDGGTAGEVAAPARSNLFAYYGSEGKRMAATAFVNYLLQRKLPYRVSVLTDESIAWVTEDSDFSHRLQESMMKLAEQGCTCRRIAGPILDMDQAFESLNRWFPLYMTGKATSYYYRRMRDNLNRITLCVVPKVAVLFSFSVGNVPQRGAVTFFTTDEKTVSSMATEFESYLSACEPIMKVYGAASLKPLNDCMLEYEEHGGGCVQRSDSLSFITLPWDVAMSLRTTLSAEEHNEFLTCFAQRYKKFKANLDNYLFVDIIRLASPEEITAGKVAIPAACVLGGEPQFYTPIGYLQHLRGILYLLEHRANYHAVLRSDKDKDSTLIYVKEDYCAILARNSTPFSLFEVSERYLVNAFNEYLRRLIPGDSGEVTDKRGVIADIKVLIDKTEKLMAKGKGN